jgi:16S rRNA (guanine(966)-N(2))-methyltransferase RsmD
MRVIAGTARGRKLASVPGDTTRPITDRAKEALFSILHHDLPDARVLDLFAGTGGVGIEALSRGAAHCDFVEIAPAAVRTIRANLDHTGLSDGARVIRRDVFRLLEDPPSEPYDLVYVAPPQYQGWWLRTLSALDARPQWVSDYGLVVVQIHPKEEKDLSLQHFEEIDRRRYGSVLLRMFAPVDDGGDPSASRA